MSVRYALKEIKRRKVRSSANVLGYLIAIAFLIVAVSLAQGYNNVAAGALESIGTHFAVYIPASKNCPCQFGDVGPYFKDTYTPTFNQSLVDAVRGIPGVADAAPCLVFRLNNLTIGGISVGSFATETAVVAPDEVVDGRYLNAGDGNSVLLDAVYAQLSKLSVGSTLEAFDRNFTVVGIVNPSLHSKPAGIENIYAQLAVVQSIAHFYGDLYGFSVRDINAIAVEVSSQGNANFINAIEQSALQKLESYAGTPGAVVGYQCGSAARKVVSVTETSAWSISAILLFSAILFSLKSQLGSVVERTKEIGVLKAIGWTEKEITAQLLMEALFQGLAGGALGIGLAYVVILLIPQLGFVPTQNLVLQVSPFIALEGLIICLVGGAIAGILPAWRAARLQSSEALRHF
jgi:putative ABC transport system permease protein